MKLTKHFLKKLIKEELSKITESKQDHIAGIGKKIERLKAEIDRAQEALDRMEAGASMLGAGEEEIHWNLMDIRTRPEYFETSQRISAMNDKIVLLIKQAQQLKQDSPGELERGD